MTPLKSYTLIYKVKPSRPQNHSSSRRISRPWKSPISNLELFTDTERILLDHQSPQWKWQVARRLSIALVAMVDMVIAYWVSQQTKWIAVRVARLLVGPLIFAWTWSLANVLLVIWQHTVIRPALNSAMDFVACGALLTMCFEASFELVSARLLGYNADGYWRDEGRYTPVNFEKSKIIHWTMFSLLVTVTLLQTVELGFSCFGLRKKKRRKRTKAVTTAKSHGLSRGRVCQRDVREGGNHDGPIGRDFGIPY